MMTYTLTFDLIEDEHDPLALHSAVAAMARALDRNCPVEGYSLVRVEEHAIVSFTSAFGNHAEALSKQTEMEAAARRVSIEEVTSRSIVKHTPA